MGTVSPGHAKRALLTESSGRENRSPKTGGRQRIDASLSSVWATSLHFIAYQKCTAKPVPGGGGTGSGSLGSSAVVVAGDNILLCWAKRGAEIALDRHNVRDRAAVRMRGFTGRISF